MKKTVCKNGIVCFEKGSGFPVVLGHSYLFDHNMWRSQIDVLSQKYRVIVPELWGHSAVKMPLPKTVESLDDIAHEVLQALNVLCVDTFAIIGLSVGGMWGAELANIAPERVKALVLMDTFVGKEPNDSHQQYFGLLAKIEELGMIPLELKKVIIPMFFKNNPEPELMSALDEKISDFSAEVLRETIVPLGRQIFGRADKLDQLKNLVMPSLVMTGQEDKPRPVHEGQQMAELLQCEHKIISDAGHISTLENPVQVNAYLLDFLSKHIAQENT